MRCAVLMGVWVLFCSLCTAGGASQREIPKGERHALVAMATCKAVQCVTAAYAGIRRPEAVARIVYYTNLLRLRPGDGAASRGLLENIPATADEYERLTTLDGNLYQGETDAEIGAVGQAYWHMSRNLAHALEVCPRFLPAFIRYGILAMPNPHDRYANWAVQMCRSNPSRFLGAFQTLSPDDRRYIAKHIIQPRGCRQIAFPEAR